MMRRGKVALLRLRRLARELRTRLVQAPRERVVVLGLVTGLSLAALVLMAWIVWPRPAPLPDFGAYEEVTELKLAFFEFLLPRIEAENERIAGQRERLLAIAETVEAGASPGWLDRRWLANLAEDYRVDPHEQSIEETIEVLLRRVDTVPPTLALVQAATESGWGRSRFAVEANNLFGQWCYRRGCGLVPANRPEGARHEVAAFDSPRESVARYINNLNSHEAYRPLRVIRAQLREVGETPTAMALSDGLILYSERREDYVEEVRTVIRQNQPLIEEVRKES